MLPLGVRCAKRNPFLLLLDIDAVYNSPSTLGNALVSDDAADGVSTIEMLRIRRACGVLLAEEAYSSALDDAERRSKTTPNQPRGRSRSRRGKKNAEGALFVPSRLSNSPYYSSRSNSRTRRRSPSPYDALPNVLGEDFKAQYMKRPRTTPNPKLEEEVRGSQSQSDEPVVSRLISCCPSLRSSQSLPPPSQLDNFAILQDEEALKEARATATANHMAFMKTSVEEMRHTLQTVTGMLLERGIIDRSQAEERPSTSPAQVTPAAPSAQPGSTIHVIEDAIVPTQFGLNQDQQVMLKFIRGEKNKGENFYEDPNAMPLRIEAWDKKRKRRIQPLIVGALNCDRLSGFVSTEMLSFSEVDKKARCVKFARNLALKPLADELEEWEESDEEEVTILDDSTVNSETANSSLVDDNSTVESNPSSPSHSLASSSVMTRPKKTMLQRIIIKKQRKIKRYQLVLLIPPATHITSVKDVLLNKIRASISTQYNPSDNNSITLSVTRAKAFSPNDRSNIVFTRNHLRLLLSSHPALYLRSSYKFASMRAVADFLIKR